MQRPDEVRTGFWEESDDTAAAYARWAWAALPEAVVAAIRQAIF